jgi:hypothetical protein
MMYGTHNVKNKERGYTERRNHKQQA